MNELALFAGAGGGILGGLLCGWRTVCAVEIDAYARDVLVARQNDGCLPPFPIWDDIRTFDGKPWRGLVDVVSGGFPCQDISAAGKGVGITGARSGLWKEMARVIGEVRSSFAWVENSPLLVGRGLGVVLADLASMGFDAEWGVVGADDTGAPHQRKRIWILAYSANDGAGRWEQQQERGESKRDVADAQHCGRERRDQEGQGTSAVVPYGWWQSEPDVGRVAHGVAARVDRLRCLGNGQVPAVVRLAHRILVRNCRA